MGHEGGGFLEKTPVKSLVFVIDEHGRTLSKESMHKLLSELFEKARNESNVDAIAVNGKRVNNCAYLASQLFGKDISEWDIIYLHGSKYPPVLLADADKEQLIALLAGFGGTSAEAIYKVLMDADAYSKFD
jgi:hypothetical protein